LGYLRKIIMSDYSRPSPAWLKAARFFRASPGIVSLFGVAGLAANSLFVGFIPPGTSSLVQSVLGNEASIVWLVKAATGGVSGVSALYIISFAAFKTGVWNEVNNLSKSQQPLLKLGR
jgi:hypothetical protein